MKSYVYNGNPILGNIPDSKVHGANMGPTWVLSAPGGLHVGLMNLAIWDGLYIDTGLLIGKVSHVWKLPYLTSTSPMTHGLLWAMVTLLSWM